MHSKQNQEWQLVPFKTKEGLTEVWLYDECWGSNIHFISDCPDHKAVCDWMNRVFRIKDDSVTSMKELNLHSGEMISIGYADGPGLKACVIKIQGEWVEGLECLTTLIHEAAHATFRILSSKGIRHNEETEEAFCYFQESIVRRLVEAMRKKVIPYPNSNDKFISPKSSVKPKTKFKNARNRPRIKKPKK